MPDLGTISVYLEPTKRKLTLDLQGEATIGDVVQGMVTHLRTAENFDVEHFLREKIGDGYAPEWQLFRENEHMQLLPPDARFADLQPPLDRDEMFTLKVNARVAAAFQEGTHLTALGRKGSPLLCGAPVTEGTAWLNGDDWRPEDTGICERCVVALKQTMDAQDKSKDSAFEVKNREPHTDPPMDVVFADKSNQTFVAKLMGSGETKVEVWPQDCKRTVVLSAPALPGEPSRLTLHTPVGSEMPIPCKVDGNENELALAEDTVVQLQKISCRLDVLPTTEDSIYYRMLLDPGTKLRIQQGGNFRVDIPGPLLDERELSLFWMAGGRLRFTILPGLGMEPPRNQQWPIRLTLEGEANRLLGGLDDPVVVRKRVPAAGDFVYPEVTPLAPMGKIDKTPTYFKGWDQTFKTVQGPTIDLTQGDEPRWISHDPEFTQRLIHVLTQQRMGFTLQFPPPRTNGFFSEHATFSFPPGVANDVLELWTQIAASEPPIIRG